MRIRSNLSVYFFRKRSNSVRSKRGFCALLVMAGIIIMPALTLMSLCAGNPYIPVDELLAHIISVINKGGHNLTNIEKIIFMIRLPETVAAIAVGIGLSVAGAVYQAIIKNPLVEPYIMGVSSGAGTFSLAAMWMGCIFFGFYYAYDPMRIITSAMVGGLLAFGCTMLIAKFAGGKSINYVFAGIIVGMLFSAIQSILIIWGCTQITSAISWLYGSFAFATWEKLQFVLMPIIILSAIPLIWSRSFNLILLGDDQATQMGMNAKRFSEIMLTIASILATFCVAFFGIIGFVGLVVPHISRMLVGSDHRLMLPVSMIIGASFLILADLLSRSLPMTYQGGLPVGMITAVIGVPIFAYLLIKRGYKYDEQRF